MATHGCLATGPAAILIREADGMASKRPIGTCHICGRLDVLSFEHIPPRAAFNERRVISVRFEEAINLGPDEVPRGAIEQRGVGGYTLCERCNNATGAWYGNEFVDWCYRGMEILMRAGGCPKLSYVMTFRPLPVIKEIVVMLFSVNHDQFHRANPDLVRFVLNPELSGLPPEYRFFTYFNTSPRYRRIGTAALMKLGRGGPILISEFAFPPYGYVMTIDSDPPDDRLFEITHFASRAEGEFEEFSFDLPLLPVHTPFPGDYRTRAEIARQVAESRGPGTGLPPESRAC